MARLGDHLSKAWHVNVRNELMTHGRAVVVCLVIADLFFVMVVVLIKRR